MNGVLKTGGGGYWWEKAGPNECIDPKLILRFSITWLNS